MQEYASLAEFNEYIGGAWITLAFINAGLAQGKNRSGLLWFIISFFIGPIATAILVILIRRREVK